MAQVAIHANLFTEPGDPRGPALLAGRCSRCAGLHFPATESCPYCASESCSIEAIGAAGRIYLATVVNSAPPGYRGEVPYGFGVVELAEGLRVVTRLNETRLEHLEPGRAVHLEISPLFVNDAGDEVLSFAYAPAHADDNVERGSGSGRGASAGANRR